MKKISSCVRPGVCEVRASARRPVSALIRLDLPTLERPAKAISMPRIGGSASTEPAAAGELPVAREQLAAGFDFGAREGRGRGGQLVVHDDVPLMTKRRSRRCHFFALKRFLKTFLSLPTPA